MKVDDMFPRKYASGEDIKQPVVLTIASVKKEKVISDLKYIIYFEHAQKGIIMSRTLADQIADVTGEKDSDQWIGKAVELYAEDVVVAGQNRKSVRARKPKVAGEPA